ncbi:DNA-processing protein DprA [Porticoccus sp. W117]|uniref:DNA-processing protein DprA n=1 Tax=Porticoccus sp. W117 TaxID=3054777 RepID=UPI00259696B3|nr:DNA-processing protein DprA [Porticoccus sp. W117]MDM3870450.1 DNA-processing protein DprA [Porticoccus sp. W117]
MNNPAPQQEAAIILQLQQLGLSTAELVSLWRSFGSFSNAISAKPEQLRPLIKPNAIQQIGKNRQRWLDLPAPRQTEGTALLPISSEDYPKLLQQLHCPPPLLYVRGNLELLALPQIAIIGSRRRSKGGGDNARAFAAELCRCGFTITSGLALGIDGEAHRGALQAQGKTIAVLASGVERIYPQRHQQLADDILKNGGALVSEMPADTKPLPAYFPQRNRIISGLSLGVLVVEAARKSGSLITARCAMEQGREVFAIPGSIHHPGARGCHQLIREGATLVEEVADIAEQLGAMVELKRAELNETGTTTDLPPEEQTLLDNLGFDPADFDTLMERTGFTTPELTRLLTSLELQGLMEQQGGRYLRIK